MQWANLGYYIHNQHQRNGYATEAVRAALEIGHKKLKYRRIEAVINVNNKISIATAKRAGMTRECIRKRFLEFDGERADYVVYISISPGA